MPAAKRPGGNAGKGRPKGVRNKATREIKDLARVYTPEALQTLANIMRTGESEQARVAAANALLDRGHGKPGQHVSVDQNLTVRDEREVIDGIADIFGLPAAAGVAAEPAQSGKVH